MQNHLRFIACFENILDKVEIVQHKGHTQRLRALLEFQEDIIAGLQQLRVFRLWHISNMTAEGQAKLKKTKKKALVRDEIRYKGNERKETKRTSIRSPVKCSEHNQYTK